MKWPARKRPVFCCYCRGIGARGNHRPSLTCALHNRNKQLQHASSNDISNYCVKRLVEAAAVSSWPLPVPARGSGRLLPEALPTRCCLDAAGCSGRLPVPASLRWRMRLPLRLPLPPEPPAGPGPDVAGPAAAAGDSGVAVDAEAAPAACAGVTTPLPSRARRRSRWRRRVPVEAARRRWMSPTQ